MTNRNLSLLFVAMIISACSGGGASADSPSDATTPTNSAASSPAPSTNRPSEKIIDNEDITAGLKGVDANNNGIRDDIDRLIAQKYSTSPAMKKAAEQEARAIQLFVEATTKNQARIAGNITSRSEDCLLKVAADFKTYITASKEIEALTANTKERFTAYWNANGLAGGMVFSQPPEPVCD